MRFMEINDGYVLPVNLDEQIVLKELEENSFLEKDKLDEYYQSIAEQMRSKGLLKQTKKNNKIVFVPNQGEPK